MNGLAMQKRALRENASNARQYSLYVRELAERGLYASKLPARDHTAAAAELVRLAALFASLPANETAKHRDQLAQASVDLSRAIGGLFDD